jgi:hypothetical protein
MANEKQDGSNLLSLEATTGRCKVGCELCFVNLGQQGNTVPLNILHPWKAVEWYEESKKKGWKAPPKDPTPEEILEEEYKDREGRMKIREVPSWRLGLATVTSATMIPKSNKAMKPSKRKKLIECNDGSMLPAILRVSSMSDSSLAPRPWLEKVRDMWGGYCFFNSNIRAIERNPELTRGVFHKLVSTMNGGYQTLHKPTPKAGIKVATGEFYKVLSRAYKKDFHEGYKFGSDTKRDVLHSMQKGKPRDENADFWNPQSLSDIGLRDYEDLIKFYRLRVCPTIWPDPHTDRPVVCTVLRFKSLAMLFEFARRYKLKAEVQDRRDLQGQGWQPLRRRSNQGEALDKKRRPERVPLCRGGERVHALRRFLPSAQQGAARLLALRLRPGGPLVQGLRALRDGRRHRRWWGLRGDG